MRLGIDVGSTTVKLVLLDESGTIIYSRYERHMSNVFETVVQLLQDLHDQYPQAVVSLVTVRVGRPFSIPAAADSV